MDGFLGDSHNQLGELGAPYISYAGESGKLVINLKRCQKAWLCIEAVMRMN